MEREHWRIWYCFLGCTDASFNSLDQFLKHHQFAHPGELTSLVSQANVDASSVRDESKACGQCPLCPDVQLVSEKDYISHVGRHLETLSLFALPSGYDDYSTGDEPTDDDNEEDTALNRHEKHGSDHELDTPADTPEPMELDEPFEGRDGEENSHGEDFSMIEPFERFQTSHVEHTSTYSNDWVPTTPKQSRDSELSKTTPEPPRLTSDSSSWFERRYMKLYRPPGTGQNESHLPLAESQAAPSLVDFEAQGPFPFDAIPWSDDEEDQPVYDADKEPLSPSEPLITIHKCPDCDLEFDKLHKFK